MSASDIVVYGSLNMDFVAYVDHLPVVGETIASNEFNMVPGGKAANQAVAAAKLGANVSLVGRVGDDELGKILKDSLKRDGVNDKHVLVTQGQASGSAMIYVGPKGENMIVTHLGANGLLSKEDIDNTEELLASAKIAVLQLEMEKEIAEYIILKAHQKGLKTVLNLAPVVPIKKEILRMVDLLIVNETEAFQLSNVEVTDVNSAKKASEVLQEIGIDNVIITLGEKGATVKTNEFFKHFGSPKVNAIDSTAAGDCFVATTTHFWNETDKLDVAVSKAVEVAALSVTRKGAQSSLPTLAEYLNFINKGV